MILMVNKLLQHFLKKNLKNKSNRIKRKGDKLSVKCKNYDNFLNTWIDKKDIL